MDFPNPNEERVQRRSILSNEVRKNPVKSDHQELDDELGGSMRGFKTLAPLHGKSCCHGDVYFTFNVFRTCR